MANIHPFFSGINVTGAADWTLQFLTDHVVSTTTALTTKPEIIISEGLSFVSFAKNSWLANWFWFGERLGRWDQ